MNRGVVLCLLLFVLLLQSVLGAQVHGSIYDHDLTVISDVVVLVNSTPQQRHISKYGGYSFDLEPGSYAIRATLTNDFVTKEIASENVTITGDGVYIVDLFIYPDINITQEFTDAENSWLETAAWVLGSLMVVLIIVLILFLVRSFFQKKHSVPVAVKEQIAVSEPDVSFNIQLESERTPVVVEDDEGALKKRILDLLSKNDGQLSQKEIRKKTNLSEAKISHTISELCSDNKIEKVRQGRSNKIVLK